MFIFFILRKTREIWLNHSLHVQQWQQHVLHSHSNVCECIGSSKSLSFLCSSSSV